MPKKSKSPCQINEELLIKVELVLNVDLMNLDESPDLYNVQSIKKSIIKQIQSSIKDDISLSPVTYSVEIIETKSKSRRIKEDTFRED